MRRAKAHLPPEERHRPKWQLALEMLDELRAWGLSPPPLVADAGYGEITAFRAALEERELAYVVEVKAATSAYGKDVLPERPAWRGSGRPPASRYRRPPASLRGLALAAGSAAASEVAWRADSGEFGRPVRLKAATWSGPIRPPGPLHWSPLGAAGDADLV